MSQIDFIGKRGRFGALSIILVIASLVLIFTKGVNKSVDFAGGSQITVQFPSAEINTADVRASVSHVDNKAQIVRNQVSTGSSFTVKIKEPEVEEGKEAEASRARRRQLEHAFAELSGEGGTLAAILKKTDVDSMTQALVLENPYGLNDTDEVIQSTYRSTAEKVVAAAATQDSAEAIAQAADAERADQLYSGLELIYPAINRTTADLLNALLIKTNPLQRPLGDSYKDIADQVIKHRATQSDFVTDLSGVLSAVQVKDGEDKAALDSFFNNRFRLGNYNITSNETFSPSIASELLAHAWEAVLLAMAGILIYITIRFTLGYALASILALAHDVTIALGAFSLVGLELSNPVVAAFLTIVGYSLNDTIVVFDRIRDNLHSERKPDVAETLNRSINETLSRTLVTSLTTLLVVIVIYVGANVTLSDFAFPLLIGIIVGTYSSIFVASPCLLVWHNRFKSIVT
ncbi:MAG: protein translocase subunit SecF [Acidobacteria bacterium]|nr:protein translocase subunit SecF [Acidobacteriota bacterium]